MKKYCLKCNKVFHKKYNYSMAYWNIQKFCSITCSKLNRKISKIENRKRSKSLLKTYRNPLVRLRLSDVRKKQWQNGFKGSTGKHWRQTEKTLAKRRGSLNPAWKGGITPLNAKLRNSLEFKLWREAVFARDNWTCQKYGTRGGKLHPHHIQNFAQYPELRFAIDNGITFSEKAHREFHKKYGKKNNTKGQLLDFLQ